MLLLLWLVERRVDRFTQLLHVVTTDGSEAVWYL